MSKQIMMQWVLGKEPMNENIFNKFLDEVCLIQEKVKNMNQALDSFLSEVKSVEINEEAKKISEETIQSIGNVIDQLSKISEYATRAQEMGKLDENVAAFAKPLGMLVGQIKDALDHGSALVDKEKVLGKVRDRWYDINVTGLQLKNIAEK
jgi:methyl-accepting chemotaxis protein